MEGDFATYLDQLRLWWAAAETSLRNLLLPSRLQQIAILAVVLAASWGLKRWAEPRMRAWMHTLEGWPRWRLRVLLILNKRMQLIFFVVLSWATYGAMRTIYFFPSRSYLMELVATIATALLLVVFATRLVRNPVLRSLVRWFLWIWVILYYLGLTGDAAAFLDSLAVELGDVRLSALMLLNALIVTGLLLFFARLVAQSGAARVRRNDSLSPSMQVLVVKILQIVAYGAAFLIGVRAVGVDLTGLAVLSGAIGVGLGFGLQKVVSNLVSGVIILLDKSIKPGDVISLGETFGWINALGARYVSITTRDGKEYLIPNEDLITGQVVNWSHSNDYVRLDIYFGTAYANDPHQVRKVAIEAASRVERVIAARPPVCHIVGFGDSSVDYILRFWITDPTGGLTNIRGNVYLALWDAFKENGISIPFPQREVKVLEGSRLETSPGAREVRG
ncbi:mechanosensitive ion channel family protein [Tranquillimonas alkanivorans]|uniref:Mechanosensitive ion channel n=1 Tax=Tranquillimonas alkanivorans TaxID=441119 RepID=A0A1I5PCH7_9RHOB|nr:mechanosensitive ion channel domain-containing protein [Tranquillimonas alkanivorans]SFP31834.1 Mechanosensitive ion channel [Tranquillimonas alkanivorans]